MSGSAVQNVLEPIDPFNVSFSKDKCVLTPQTKQSLPSSPSHNHPYVSKFSICDQQISSPKRVVNKNYRHHSKSLRNNHNSTYKESLIIAPRNQYLWPPSQKIENKYIRGYSCPKNAQGIRDSRYREQQKNSRFKANPKQQIIQNRVVDLNFLNDSLLSKGELGSNPLTSRRQRQGIFLNQNQSLQDHQCQAIMKMRDHLAQIGCLDNLIGKIDRRIYRSGLRR